MRIGKEKGMERVGRSTHTKGAAGGEGRVRTKLGGVWGGGQEEGRSGAEIREPKGASG